MEVTNGVQRLRDNFGRSICAVLAPRTLQDKLGIPAVVLGLIQSAVFFARYRTILRHRGCRHWRRLRHGVGDRTRRLVHRESVDAKGWRRRCFIVGEALRRLLKMLRLAALAALCVACSTGAAEAFAYVRAAEAAPSTVMVGHPPARRLPRQKLGRCALRAGDLLGTQR